MSRANTRVLFVEDSYGDVVFARRALEIGDGGGFELTVAGSIRDIVALLSQIERTSRLLTVKDVKVRVVAVGQPRELLTTLTVAGYLLPTAGGN